jgi:uncharacterized protein YndB with AHSA1/START domain
MAASNGLTLDLTRTLPAERATVWRAITDPDELTRWWGPKGFTSPGIEFEPRVGGRYRIAMQPPEGEPFQLHGEFREVDAPVLLSFTFLWDPPDPDDRETVATITLEENGGRTELSFTQGEFATEERLELHRGGWSDSLDKLEALLR